MLVQVDIDNSNNTIDFAPKDKLSEIIQNIRNIFNLTKGQVPYQRGIGFNEDIIDLPIGKAVMIYQIDMIKQVKQYEPRVQIKSFDWTNGSLVDGNLKVKVTIEIDRRYL